MTITLTAVLSSLLSFLAGLWSATHLQDREVRRRHLGLARALLAELDRVFREMGAKNPTYISASIAGAGTVVPQLAPWVQELAVDLASANAQFLPRVMELHRYLHNLSVEDEIRTRILTEAANLKSAIEAHRANGDSVAIVVSEGELRTVREAATRSAERIDFDFQHAKTELLALQSILTDAASDLESAARTHLPWVGRNRQVRAGS